MTALVLETMRQHCPLFQKQLFAVVGVSGGSLGVALAAAAAVDAPPVVDTETCDLASFVAPPASAAVTTAGTDVLRPLLRGALFVDLPMRLIPVGFVDQVFRSFGWNATADALSKIGWGTDRARYLERGVEVAWNEAGGTKPLRGRSFAASGPATRPDLPYLILLATDVSSGRRVAMSQLSLGGAPGKPVYPCLPNASLATSTSEDRARMLTASAVVPRFDPDLLAAAITSARFPILTPAATLPCNGPSWRLVDGGYFENSGLTTVLDLIEAMAAGAHKANKEVNILLVRIENHDATTDLKTRADADIPGPPGWLSKLGSPVRAFLGTREARADLARRTVDRAAKVGRWCNAEGQCVNLTQDIISLHRCRVAVPLGWSLSPKAKSEIASQVLDMTRADGADDTCSPKVKPTRPPDLSQLAGLGVLVSKLP
jgi:hypothetical protein